MVHEQIRIVAHAMNNIVFL